MNLSEVVQRIEQRIRELNTTERAVSIRAGLSSDGIRNWKRRAETDPKAGANIQSLGKIAQELDVTLSWLTTGVDGPTDGFSEQAEAWTPPQAAADSIARLYEPMARNAAATHRATSDMGAFGILAGDWLVCDLSRLPSPGDLAIVTVSDPDTGESRTIVRRYVPPYLMDGGTAPHLRLEHVGDPNVTPRYPIIGTIRGL